MAMAGGYVGGVYKADEDQRTRSAISQQATKYKMAAQAFLQQQMGMMNGYMGQYNKLINNPNSFVPPELKDILAQSLAGMRASQNPSGNVPDFLSAEDMINRANKLENAFYSGLDGAGNAAVGGDGGQRAVLEGYRDRTGGVPGVAHGGVANRSPSATIMANNAIQEGRGRNRMAAAESYQNAWGQWAGLLAQRNAQNAQIYGQNIGNALQGLTSAQHDRASLAQQAMGIMPSALGNLSGKVLDGYGQIMSQYQAPTTWTSGAGGPAPGRMEGSGYNPGANPENTSGYFASNEQQPKRSTSDLAGGNNYSTPSK